MFLTSGIYLNLTFRRVRFLFKILRIHQYILQFQTYYNIFENKIELFASIGHLDK